MKPSHIPLNHEPKNKTHNAMAPSITRTSRRVPGGEGAYMPVYMYVYYTVHTL